MSMPLNFRESNRYCGLLGHNERDKIDRSLDEVNTDTDWDAKSLYSYEPLPSKTSFRVLELFGGEQGDNISYKLHVADWNDPPDYDALSYTWGDPTAKESTICDGRKINVTLNLMEALHQLRQKTHRMLWIDAVCIDQEGNPEEKANQVNNMRQIYCRARTVIVWLGLDTDGHAATAAVAMKEITHHCCIANSISVLDLRKIRHLKGLAMKTTRWKDLLCNNNSTWQSLYWLFSRSWFSRVWVLQEVTAGSNVTVVCGDVEMNWDIVGLVAEYITVSRDLFDSFEFSKTQIWCAVWQRDRRLHEGPSLDLLTTARGMNATKLVDKVYGLLGMPAFTNGDFTLCADYRKSVAEVYQGVADVALNSMQNLDLLAHVQHDSEIADDVPSWVPQWNRGKIRLILMLDLRHLAKRNASKGLRFEYSRNPENKILKVHGIRFDVVKTHLKINCDEWFNSENHTLENHPVLAFWHEQSSNTSNYPTGERILQAYSIVLTTGFGSKAYRVGERLCYLQNNFAAYILRLMTLSGHLIAFDNPLHKEAQGGNWRFWESVARMTGWGHSFFTTELGYMGLGSQVLEAGDVICVLAGGEVPFILREEGDHYKFVGECYLHGIMDGEAVHPKAQREVFEIH